MKGYWYILDFSRKIIIKLNALSYLKITLPLMHAVSIVYLKKLYIGLMKKIFILFLFTFSLIMNNALAKIPKVEEVISKKGYKLWMIEDNYLPIVSIKIAFTKSGTAYDKEEKKGLSYMVTGLLDEGAGGISSFEYRKKLEALASTISFDVDEDNFYVNVKTLKDNLEETLKLLNLTLTKPNLKPEVIERIRNQILVIIQKKLESPQYVASKKFKESIFGEHPYSRTKYGNADTIKSISRENIVDYVNNTFSKENIVISVVGDVSKSKIKKLLDKYLKLEKGLREVVNIPDVNINKKKQHIKIPKGIQQSVVYFGSEGLKRSDKDFYPAYIMNHILGGGGFESRLLDTVREKNGLAYSTYSYLSTYHKAGLFVGYVGTDAKRVDKSISLIKKELNKLYKNGVTEKELSDAKDYLVNSYPLKMTKNENLATYLSVMQLEDLGIDFLEKRNDYVRSVTVEQVKNMAQRMLDVDKMTFVVVGND